MIVMTNLQIFLVQMDIETNNPQNNYKKAESLITSAFEKQHIDRNNTNTERIIVLPELFTVGFGNFSEVYQYAEYFADQTSKGASNTLAKLSHLSKELNSAIIGSVPEKDNNQYFNTAFLSYNGETKRLYRKIHLFHPMEEKEFFAQGMNIETTTLYNEILGVQICYDLRFPEAARKLSETANIIFFPANWPAVRGIHWDVLLRARAIENQIFVVGVNRIGSDKWGEYYGHSQVISPLGEILSSPLDSKEQVIMVQIETTKTLVETRKKFNIHKDRVLGITLPRSLTH